MYALIPYPDLHLLVYYEPTLIDYYYPFVNYAIYVEDPHYNQTYTMNHHLYNTNTSTI